MASTSRNRTITACNALYVSPSPGTGAMFFSGNSGANLIQQLDRIQSVNHGASINRQFINQYGSLAPVDQVIIDSPTVPVDFSYLVVNGTNASGLGFVTNGTTSFLSGILDKSQDEKNFFLLTSKEGVDAIGDTSADSTKVTWGFGNGYINKFGAKGSVGSFPTEDIGVEALNVVVFLGATGLNSPAIIPASGIRVSNTLFTIPTANSGDAGAVSAIRPGDIQVTFSETPYGVNIADAKIQSYDISVGLGRQALQKLGSPFAFSRELNYPIEVTASIECEVGAVNSGDLSAILCNDQDYTLTVQLYKNACPGSTKQLAVQYQIVGAKFEGQQNSTSIGQNAKSTLTYKASVGGSADQVHNFYYSGSNV